MVAYDDSGSKFPLSPKAIVAFELSGQADGGTREGTYLELGIRPSIKLIGDKYPLSLAVPVKTGLSLKDYYEGVSGDSTFGYFDTGAVASVAVTLGKIDVGHPWRHRPAVARRHDEANEQRQRLQTGRDVRRRDYILRGAGQEGPASAGPAKAG